MTRRNPALALVLLFAFFTAPARAQEAAKTAAPEPIPLWPRGAPGDKGDVGEEKDTTKPDPNVPPAHPDYIIRLGNVSKPTISVYKPPAEKDTGAAVVVCPGGGYSILAMNLEGTEVCKWLNDHGITGVLLKYRVPSRRGEGREAAPLQDVQRAVGLVRHRAAEWKINPKNVGVLGFSAGGHLAASASNNFATRTYPAVDEADKLSCRPDFAVLVYPAYLVTKEDRNKLSPDMKVSGETPPTLLVMTQDDELGVENVYTYALALRNAKVPCETHVYPSGGHGYGLRPGKYAVSTEWPKRVIEWMGATGIIQTTATGAREDAKPASGELRWYKGNLHTHSLWSDGDDFPERITAWYRDRGYHFLAISDHNTLQEGERWVKYSALHTKGAGPAVDKYAKEFPTLAKLRGDRAAGTQEVRLTPFAEYRSHFEKPGEFLLIQSEEISAKFEKKPIHMNATNIAEVIKPQDGGSVVEVIRNNFRAVEEQGKRLNRPILPHLNHPNFGWGVTAEELAEVVEERFFEVYNGHPGVEHEGDKDHPSVERIWDIANTLRLATFRAAPLMGLGTDDSHHYHVGGMSRSGPGRGWVQVRAKELTPDALIAAMQAGDFYASSGVTLRDVKFDPASRTLSLEIEPDGQSKFTTQFIGTIATAGTPAPQDVGVVLSSVEGPKASYKLTGRELYVRAMVMSDQPPESPSFKGQKKQAWTQPVGWEKHVGK